MPQVVVRLIRDATVAGGCGRASSTTVTSNSTITTAAGGAIMKQTSVSIRELKSRLSHYLRLVMAGEAVEITDRGIPVGRIVPTVAPVEDRIEAMARSGLLRWNNRKLERRAPAARVKGKRTVADLLVEDRE
jgi:prevent-host-death family protein